MYILVFQYAFIYIYILSYSYFSYVCMVIDLLGKKADNASLYITSQEFKEMNESRLLTILDSNKEYFK